MCKNKKRRLRKDRVAIVVGAFALLITCGFCLVKNHSSDRPPIIAVPPSSPTEENPETTKNAVTSTTEQTTTATTPETTVPEATEKVFTIAPSGTYYTMANGNFENDVVIDEETTNYIYYSESDIKLLAGLIEAEAGNVSTTTRRRVGTVVLNRVRSELFPNSIEAVISQPNQYETYREGLLPEDPTDENMYIAKEMLNAYYSEIWASYCRNLLLSEKAVYQVNDCIDISSYAFVLHDEYGETYHMVYGESIYDYSDMPYSFSYV